MLTPVCHLHKIVIFSTWAIKGVDKDFQTQSRFAIPRARGDRTLSSPLLGIRVVFNRIRS
jgi:hypothetical protein